MKIFIIILLFLFFITQVHTQIVVVEDSLFSASVNSIMNFCVVLPEGYSKDRDYYTTVYLLHGYNQNYKDWIKQTELVRYASNYNFIFVAPDGKNSWYSNSIIRNNANYEDYIIKELIAYVDKKYRTVAQKFGRAVVGLSMGGYGSAKLALKHDSLFFFAASLSPAIHVPFGLEDTSIVRRRSKKSMQSIREIFGATRSKYWEENDVFSLAQKVNTATTPFFYLAVGSQDKLTEVLELTYKFAVTLRNIHIPFELHESAGAHNWQFWNKELEIVLKRILEIGKRYAK
jgi:S-formylglutathione hydrolase FrmB